MVWFGGSDGVSIRQGGDAAIPNKPKARALGESRSISLRDEVANPRDRLEELVRGRRSSLSPTYGELSMMTWYWPGGRATDRSASISSGTTPATMLPRKPRHGLEVTVSSTQEQPFFKVRPRSGPHN